MTFTFTNNLLEYFYTVVLLFLLHLKQSTNHTETPAPAWYCTAYNRHAMDKNNELLHQETMHTINIFNKYMSLIFFISTRYKQILPNTATVLQQHKLTKATQMICTNDKNARSGNKIKSCNFHFLCQEDHVQTLHRLTVVLSCQTDFHFKQWTQTVYFRKEEKIKGRCKCYQDVTCNIKLRENEKYQLL